MVADRGGLHRGPALLTGPTDAEAHHRLRGVLARQRTPAGEGRQGKRPAVLVEDVEAVEDRADRSAQQLLGGAEAERPHGGVVREQQVPVRTLGGHRVGHALEDRLELAARLLALLLGLEAGGDVADHPGEHRRIRLFDAVHGQLDRELLAVRPHARELHALADDAALAGLQVAPQPLAVARAQAGRDHELGELLADGGVLGVAEEALRRAVELDHAALVVDRDDGVQRRVEDRALAGLAHAHRLLRPQRLEELADLVPERLGEPVELGIALADLA